MKRRHLLAASLGSPFLGACQPGGAVIDYRYRFKVVVELDGIERAGSSVIRVRWRDRSGETLRKGDTHFPLAVNAVSAALQAKTATPIFRTRSAREAIGGWARALSNTEVPHGAPAPSPAS